ncbi:hypothetical protein ABPG74_007831 [Tetrahymena malaccensis]
MNQQLDIANKQCSQHNKQIMYLHINKIKNKQIGACLECVTSNELNGKNLVMISEIKNIIENPKAISNKYPFLQDKNILKDYQEQIAQEDIEDPIQMLKIFFSNFKSKISSLIERCEKTVLQNAQQKLVNKEKLIETYNQVSKRGQFKAAFIDYMLDDDKGQGLTQLIERINNDQENNANTLKENLQSYKDAQTFFKNYLQIQEKISDITINIIEMIGNTFIFDNQSQQQQEQIQIIQNNLNEQLSDLCLSLPQQDQGQNQQIEENEENQLILQFMEKDPSSVSLDLMKLFLKIQKSEIKFLKYTKQNISDNQNSLIKKKFQQFQRNIHYYMYQYGDQVLSDFCQSNNLKQQFVKINKMVEFSPYVYQINYNLLQNQYKINVSQQQEYIFVYPYEINNNQSYSVKLELVPFQNNQDKYTFQIGLNQAQFYYQSNSQLEKSYFISNVDVKGRMNTKADNGMDIKDQKIAYSQQMRNLEFLFCLKEKQLKIQDSPKRENVTIAFDERLEQIGLNQKFNFFIKTQNIQYINFVEFVEIQ